MPDVAIVNTTNTPAPADYLVPGTQELQVKAVRAAIDGSGAAASFLPALQLLDPAGHVMWTAVDTSSSLAAGASADVSWFPDVSHTGSTASGSVLGAYKSRNTTDTFGPVSGHNMLFGAGSLISNDSTVFSSPDNFTIQLAHGGLVMAGLTGTFGTNGGVAYAGEFQMETQILDSLSAAVNQLVGPDIYTPELYATDPGDTFEPSGYSVWNCDDSVFTPPYNLTGGITVLKNVTFTNYAMFVAILSPTGLH